MDYTSAKSSAAESNQLMHDISRPGVTNQEVMEKYKVWASHYSQDLSQISWNSPRLAAEQLIKWVTDKSARILDAAAGTGLCGQLVHDAGYTNLDALDASQEMLDEAAKRNIYKNLIQAFMGPNRLPVENDVYDAIVTVGSFVPGHVKEDCFEELIRIVRPGGHIVMVMCERYFTENPAYAGNIEPRMQQLAEAGCWKLLARTIVPRYHDEYNGVAFILQPVAGKNDVLAKLKV